MAPARKPSKKAPSSAKPNKKSAAKKEAPKRASPKPAPKATPKPAPKPAPAAKPAPKAAPPAPTPPPAPKPAPLPAAKPAPAPPVPTFVREASAADRKAALEALLEKEGVGAIFPTVTNPTVAKPAPSYVRERSAQERKAVVEQLVQDSGVASALSKAPWKRGGPGPAPATTPPTPAAPVADKSSARATMTKAPLAAEAGKSAPKTVILDSNALMMQFQFHIDIEREVRRILNINFDVVVPTTVVKELERLSREGTAKEQGEARMALELAKTFRVEESPGDGDVAILRIAEKLNAVVVTNDKRLRATLRAKDIPNIYMRSRAFLTLEGHIPGM